MTTLTKTIALWACSALSVPVAVGAQTAASVAHPQAIVFDHDADFDDTVALAALAQQHIDGRINLRAVTITNNGGGLPGKAYQHTRCLLDSLGLDDVPVADATYDLPHAFPGPLRFGVDLILDGAIPDCAAGHVPPAQPASELLANEIAAANGRITLIATGPVTNVARALDRLRDRYGAATPALLTRAYIQAGALRVMGGLEGVPGFDNTQTLNVWGDPAAAQAVFEVLRPGSLFLVPHDATDYVPVRLEYLAELAANAHTPAAHYVATMMNHPLILSAIKMGLAVFWWDPLATLAVTTPDLVEFDWTPVDVILDGPSSGRTIESTTGVRMRVAFSADMALFERTLLDVLNGR